VKHALQNTQNDCHQWLSDSSELHQIADVFGRGSDPDPVGGGLQRSPNFLAGLRAPTSKRGGCREGIKWREREKREGKEREERVYSGQ